MDKIQIIEKLFLHIVYFSYLLLPLGFLLSRNNKKDTIPVTIALYGIIFFVLLQAYQYLPKSAKTLYQCLYTYLEYLAFAFFFWKNINSKLFKRFMLIASATFFLFLIFYITTIKVNRLDTIPIGIETILLFVYILYFFYQFSKEVTTSYIYNHYAFWIALGILIYLGGSFFFFILIEHLDRDEVAAFGNITYVAEIIKNILFAAAIYIYSKHPFKTKSEKQVHVPFLDTI